MAKKFLIVVVCILAMLAIARSQSAPSKSKKFLTAVYACPRCYRQIYGAYTEIAGGGAASTAEWQIIAGSPQTIWHDCEIGGGYVILGEARRIGADVSFVAPLSNDPNPQPQPMNSDPDVPAGTIK